MMNTASRALTMLLAGAGAAALMASGGTATAATTTPRVEQCSSSFYTVDSAHVLRGFGVTGGRVHLQDTLGRVPYTPRRLAEVNADGDGGTGETDFVAVTPSGELQMITASHQQDSSGHTQRRITTRHLADGWSAMDTMAAAVVRPRIGDAVLGLNVYGISHTGDLHHLSFDPKFKPTGDQVVMRRIRSIISLDYVSTGSTPHSLDKLLATTSLDADTVNTGDLQEITFTYGDHPEVERTLLKTRGWDNTQNMGSARCSVAGSTVEGYLRVTTDGALSLFSDTDPHGIQGDSIQRIGDVTGTYQGHILATGL